MHSNATTRTRSLEALREADGLGAEHHHTLLTTLDANPRATVLDIGCGTAEALRDLKRRYPAATFYGLDQERLDRPTDDAFTFLHQSIETSLPAGTPKFDLIFSVATFPYVDDMATALKNVAKSLKPDGKAILMMEPFYLGPHGLQMFSTAAARWDKDLKALLVYPGDGNNIMQGFTKYPMPPELRIQLYIDTRTGLPSFEIPAFYPARAITSLRERAPLGEKSGSPIINWSAFAFLQVKTSNPRGPQGAGDDEHRAFRFAAPRVYLREAGLSVTAVALTLLDETNYDAEMRKPDYRPTRDQTELKQQILTYTRLRPDELPNIFSPTCAFLTAAAAIAIGIGALAMRTR